MAPSDTSSARYAWSRYATWFALAAIVLLALALRLFRLSELMTFTYDQGRDMYVWQNISRGDLTLIGPTTGLAGFFVGPFYYYLLWPGFVFSQGSPIGVASWQIVIACITLPFAYLFLKPSVGKTMALLATLLLALTPGAITQSRMIWNPSVMVPVLLPMLVCLQQSRQRPWMFAGATFLYGLALQTEFAYMVFLAPVMALWLGWYSPIFAWLTQRWHKLPTPSFTYSWQWLSLAVATGALTLLPQLLFEIRNQGIMSQSLLREFQDQSKQVPLSQIWATRPPEMFAELQNSLFGSSYGSRWSVWLILGLVAALALKPRKTNIEWLTLGLTVAPIVGLLLHRGNYGYFFNYYITAHYYILIIAVVLALHTWRFRWRMLGAGALLTLWTLHFAGFAQTIYNPSLLQYTIGHQLRALRFIRSQVTTNPVALSVMVPNQLPINYQYLNEWLAQRGEGALDFGLPAAHRQYFLLYEPADSSHEITFDPWYAKLTTGATCDSKATFGILTAERCQK